MALLRVGFFAAGLLFSLGEMGFMTEALNLLLSLSLALVFLAMNWPRRWSDISTGRALIGILLLIFAALSGQGETFWRLLAFVALATAVHTVLPKDDPRRNECARLIPTVFFFSVFVMAVRHVPHLWWLTNAASQGFSRTVGKILGQDYLFGATASGFRIMVFVACWGLSRLIWSRRRAGWSFSIFLLLLIATTALVEMLLTPLAMFVQRWAPKLDFLLFNSQVLFLAAALAPLAWYRHRTRGEGAPPGEAFQRWVLPVVVVAGVLLGLGFTFVPATGPGSGRVLIYDEGFLNWETPIFGRYGERSGGMFGRLPGFLEAQGYEVIKTPKPLTAESLSGADALVFINVMQFLDPEEKRAVWDYVAGGGSLLVLGDHTGVKGIRGPFNDALEPFNIEFLFDSGTFWAQGWRDALELMPHSTNRGIQVSEDIQIWVGASLTFAPPAKPVIVGKYGYSDIGDAANLERSYLGDRRYNPGELLSDICLVAEAPYGKGRVLVFGDTSPFQNGALVTAWAYVQRVFQWLTNPSGSSGIAWRIVVVAVGVVLLVLARGGLARSAYAWAFLVLGMAVGTWATERFPAPAPLPGLDVPKALIDVSHVERFDQLTWYDDCVGGLELNLMRNGYCTMLMREFSMPLLEDSELLVVIAPAKPFSSEEIEAIRSFTEAGGTLILSTGYEEKDRSESLFSLFGARVRNVPLAHFDVNIYGLDVHFPKAWPLDISDPATIAIAHHPNFPDPMMVYVPRGEGGALLIGDSQFLLNSNLESLEEWNVNNIMFFKTLLERLKSGEMRP